MAMRYYAPSPGGRGDPYRPRGPHLLRVGDAERDAVAEDLGEHYAAGRLTLDELHERLEAVFAAKTFGHLARIVADLPGTGRLPRLASAARPPGLLWGPDMPGPGGSWDITTKTLGGAIGPAGAGFQPGPGFQPGGFQPGPGLEQRGARHQSTSADRAGKFAALSLLILAMLIWLFTALLFARHGFYHQVGPMGPPNVPIRQFGPFGPAGG